VNNRFLLLIFFSVCVNSIIAQSLIKKESEQLLVQQQDSLASYGQQMVVSTDAATRFRSDSFLTRILVRALKTPHSFHFPFDSLTTISRIYSPDSLFRIFSWQVSRDEDLHRRHGAIQMKTNDGSLKLFPLIDRSFLISDQKDTVTNHEWWIGAIYYKILMNEFNKKKYYTLLGYDENSIRSTKKRIEVLHFNDAGQPVFGGSFFSFAQDTVRKKDQSRFWIEYKKNGNGRLLYDEEMKMIMYDHLISETNEPAKKFTYVPDGDYEAFKWVNGKWLHVEKVFTFKLIDGQAPVEKPLNESKLKPVKKG
jgi:hypothetical protein